MENSKLKVGDLVKYTETIYARNGNTLEEDEVTKVSKVKRITDKEIRLEDGKVFYIVKQ